MDYNKINELLKNTVNGRYRIGIHKLTSKIYDDDSYELLKCFLDEYYVRQGYGVKGLIKKFNLEITYTSFRNIIKFLCYELHSNNIATDALRLQRSENAKRQYKEKSGFFKDGIQENIHKKNINRGIQGYYWNSFRCKYVWLRSSWEYIYAKWLNKQNIDWDVEVSEYRLSDGTLYRPDFFLYENGVISKIVEVKGFWKNRLYKVKLLEDEYNINVIIVDDIKPYCENNISEKNEIKIWKNLRKLELKK